jgi:hypothetical protein
VATDRQIAANRRNARRSTGPRSRAAKKRSSQNSFRHGLSAGATVDAERIKRVETLARKIAGAKTDFVTLECARTIAQAQFDLAQVGRVKLALMSLIKEFRGSQMRQGDAAAKPTIAPNSNADSIQRALSELIRLDRYERRAAVRRARAVHILLERKKAETI